MRTRCTQSATRRVLFFCLRPWISAQLETELSDALAKIATLGAAFDAATAALEREREASSDAADEAVRHVDEAARAARVDKIATLAKIATLGAACDAATDALEREREAASDAADDTERWMLAACDADARAESLQARVRKRRAVDAAAVTSCRGRDPRVSYRRYCHRRDLTWHND